MSKNLLTYLNDKSRNLYYLVVEATAINESNLGIVRMLVGLFMGLFYMPNFSWLAQVPDSFFNPPMLSLAAFFNTFPSALFLKILDILLIFSVLCLTLGVKARWAGCFYAICFLIGSSFEFSLGAVSHVFLLPAVFICLSFSNWGVYYALFPDRYNKKFRNIGLSLAAILISFAFFTAGIFKLSIWMDFNLNTSGFLNWFYSGYFNFNRSSLLTDWVFSFPTWLLESMDYIVILFEITAFLFLLKGEKYWKIWLLSACFFHLGTTLFLNIHFIQHIPVYAVFLLPPFIDKFRKVNLKKTYFIVPVLPFVLHFYLVFIGSPRINLFSKSLFVDEGTTLISALICWILLIGLGGYGIIVNKETKKSLKAIKL